MGNSLKFELIKEDKQQLNEVVPVVLWYGAVAVTGLLSAALGYNALTKSHEDQKMVSTDKGYFNDEMWIGEKFKITYFDGSGEPYELMDVGMLEKKTGWKCYSDENGYYLKIKNSSIDSGTDLRVYLPKKEWFDQFKGSIRSITDYEGTGGSKEKNTYGLCFYLKSPQNAIKTRFERPDGTVFFGPPQNILDPVTKQYTDDPSRGWSVLDTYKMSGYFTTEGNVYGNNLVESSDKNNVINEVGLSGEGGYDDYYGSEQYIKNAEVDNGEARKNKLNGEIMSIMNNPPSGLQEYEWATYGEKYGRSEFDRWYDGSSGTWIVIGLQIAGSIAFAPLAEGWAAYAASSASYSARKFAVYVGSELILGAWEASYLYNRGLTSQAGLVLFCCFLPLLTESTAFGRLIGRPPGFDQAINNLVYDVGSRSLRGSFITPAEFKKWFKGLEPGLRQEIQNMMEISADYYSKVGTKSLQNKIVKAMSDSLITIKESGIKGADDIMALKKWNNLSRVEKLAIQLRIRDFYGGKNGLKNLEAKYGVPLGSAITQGKYQFLKTIGITIFAVGGVLMPICVFAIGDNEEMVKDPQGILNGSENTIKSFMEIDIFNAEKLSKKIKDLASKAEVLIAKGDKEGAFILTKEYIKILVDLNYIDKTPQWGDQKREYHKYIESFKFNVLTKLNDDYNKAQSDANVKKMVETAEKINKITALGSGFDSIDGTPKNYSLVQNGFTDEYGKITQITNEELIKFIEWFSGYNVINKTITNSNPYQKENNITIGCYYNGKISPNQTKEYSITDNNERLTNRMIKLFYPIPEIPGYQGMNLYDMNNSKYWGNVYFIRYIFTQYFDDYILHKNKITTDKQ